MTFSDIFKSSFLKNVTSVSVLDMVLALGLAFAIGLFIFLIYRMTYAGVMYSSSFGVTLVGLTMISTFVILAVTSNVVLSLGMVGALSIVRFRTAIKEPLDITFLFWSIAAGIVLAAGMIPLAVLGSVFIGLVLLVFANKKSHVAPYMVVLHCANQDAEKHAMDFLQAKVKKCVVKSKTVRAELRPEWFADVKTAGVTAVELNAEIRLQDENTGFVNALSQIPGVESAVLVSYNGEYMG